ncbi:MAG: nucleoside hydrolase [Planctomycetota bacterium]|jgi:purine nucleosidase/pyrimidine-specific ribonucleoside hydrolase
MPIDTVPIIYDTDLGEDIDDLYALYLALFHPRIQLLAVTTVHGDTQAKARLAQKVLRLAGRTDIPVGAGISMSQARVDRGQTEPDPNKMATYIKYLEPSDPEWNRNYPHATEVISKVIDLAHQPIALVGEGAFSNLAAVVDPKQDSVHRKIRCIAVMAGETQTVMSEYNVYCDPEAADCVFNCGLPVFMATYSVAGRLRMTMDDMEEQFGTSTKPAHRVLAQCTRLWAPHKGIKPGPVLYDLVPLFWLADPNSVKTRRSCIRVELEGTYTRGQTLRVGRQAGSVMESIDLNPENMIAQFVEIMK